MVETDTVEGVEERETALDLVRLDHALEDIMDGQRLALASEMIGDRENGPQVIRRVSPLSREEAVVVVEPPDLGADVECTADRVQLVVGTRNLGTCETSLTCHMRQFVTERRTVGNDSTLHNRAQEVRAGREPQGLQTASNGVNQTQTRRLERERRVDLVVVHVVGDVLQHLVRVRSNRALSCVGVAGHLADSEAGSGCRNWSWESRRTSECRLDERDSDGGRVNACKRDS